MIKDKMISVKFQLLLYHSKTQQQIQHHELVFVMETSVTFIIVRIAGLTVASFTEDTGICVVSFSLNCPRLHIPAAALSHMVYVYKS